MKFLSPMGVPLRFHWNTIALPIVLSMIYGVSTGLTLSILFLLSVIFHEYGHAWTAQRCGARAKSVRVVCLGGWTEIVFDPEKFSTNQEGWVYLSGPIASLILTAFAAFLWPLYPASLVTYLFIINLLIFLLNLLPVIPLDGGRYVAAMLANKHPRYKANLISMIVGLCVVFPILGLLMGLGARFLSLLVFLILVRSVFIFFKENWHDADFPNENEGL